MKFLIAIDSFKGSLTSAEAGESVCRGLLRVHPDAEVHAVPVSDGGDGMLSAFVSALGGELVKVPTRDAMMRRVDAEYGVAGDTAIVEVAQSVGLSLIAAECRNPMVATSYGVGLMIADAVGRGIRRFIVGLGGSATTDGGMGMLRALIDRLGRPGCHDTFDQVRESHFADCKFLLASDVRNPLLGPDGAARVFGPQKGATPQMVEQLEQRLRKFSEMSARHSGRDCSGMPGAGAAGGLGYAFMQFLDGRVVSGADWLLDRLRFEELLSWADVVITGEGHSDRQTLMGQLPAVVLRRSKAAGKPVVLLSGGVSDTAELLDAGFRRVIAVADPKATLEENMKKEKAESNVEKGAGRICRDEESD